MNFDHGKQRMFFTSNEWELLDQMPTDDPAERTFGVNAAANLMITVINNIAVVSSEAQEAIANGTMTPELAREYMAKAVMLEMLGEGISGAGVCHQPEGEVAELNAQFYQSPGEV